MQRYRRTLSFPASMLFCGLLVCNSAFAIVASQVDDFEDGTEQGWQEGASSPNPPVVTDLEAPLLGGTYSLRNQSSGGGGPGSRWAMFNTSAKWQGNYVAAGIAEIRMWVQVYGGNPQAYMRVGFESSGGRLVSTESVVVPNSGGWYLVVLPIGPGDLTQVSGAGTYNSIMSDVTNFRIISSVTTKWEGDSIIHQIGVDNIKALTEPSLYQGWLWSDGIFGFPPTYHEEEYCFGPVVVEIAGDDTVLLGGEEACWGRSTNNANPPRSYWGFNGITFTDVEFFEAIGSRPLVSAGGNLLEVFAFDEFDEEERAATVIAEPSDSDLLMLGGADGDDFSGFAYVDMMVKTSPDVIASRVASDLQGRWRITFFSRVLDRTDVNVEAVAAGIQTFDLQGGGTCTFAESLVFQDPAYDTNGETFVAAQFDVDGIDLTDRGVMAELANASVTGCTYGLDQDGYLSMTFTETDDSGPSQLNFRYAVADDNNYLVWTFDPDSYIEYPTSLAVAYRAPSAMDTSAIDGNYLFYLSATDYASTGTAHSSGETGLQEFDFQGRGMLSFDSNQPGTVPAGQSGSWFECEIEMVQDGAEYQVDGQPGMFTVSTVLEIDSEYTPFTGCDYNTSADGSLLLNVEVTDPSGGAEQVLFSGYVNDNGEVLSAINFVSDPAPSAGIEDAGAVRHIIAMEYTGDPAGNEDDDAWTNLEEFQLPLPPAEPFRRIAAVPNIGDSAAPELAVALPGSVNGHVRDAGTDTLIRDLTFNAGRTPIDTGVADINGSPAFAVLGQDVTGRAWVEVRDALTDALVRDVWFSSGYTPIALAVLPDMNGNSISEVAVLLRKESDGRTWVHIKDASTLAVVSTVWFQTGYTPLDLEFVPNVDPNPGPELAVLMTRNSDGRTWVHVKDAQSGAPVKDVWYQAEHTPKDLAVIDNLDGLAVGSLDDFEDGTTQGWGEGGASPNPPINVADGGPDGAGDNYLENTSSGSGGPGGRQVMFNTTTWTGDYVAAGIQAIRLQAKVVSGAAASLRVAFGSNTGTRYASTAAVNVPNDGNWHDVFLPVLAGDLTLVEGADSYTATMSAVTQMRIMSAVSPSWRGDTVAMTLGFDNIKAVPGADLAVLFVRDSDSRTWVHMKDAKTGNFVRNIWFDSGFTPSRLEIIPDLNANTGDELAVLTTKDLDARAWVLVKDALSGAPIRNVWFQDAFAPKDFAVLPDMDANPGSELAVLGVKDSGQVQVEIKDAKTNAFINQVDFP